MRHSELSFYDKEDRPWPALRLTSAAIVGHTTTSTARIWVRVHCPGDYALVISSSPIPADRQPAIRNGKLFLTGAAGETEHGAGVLEAEIGFATDNTHVFDVADLMHGSRYHYALLSKDLSRSERWEVGRDEEHSFVTESEVDSAIVFGFFSCHMPFKGRNVFNQDMWESFGQVLSDLGAHFVIGGGDQVYADGDKHVDIWSWLTKNKDAVVALSDADQIEVMRSWYRDVYRGYWGDLGLRRVLRGYPTYMIWDDHEIMDGWGSYKDAELSNKLDTIWEWEDKAKNLRLARNMFAAAKETYREYQHSHNPPTSDGQWDYGYTWGRLAFYVLDMRGHRRYSTSSPYKVLGKAQFNRVEAWFSSPEVAAAEALFLVSPVPMVHASDFVVNHADIAAFGLADDLRDEWEHDSNRNERNKLLDAIFDFAHSTGKPVVILSGDVHIGAAFRIARRGHQNAKVFQLTSSAITYCKAPGGVLKLVVRETGVLSGIPDSKRTTAIKLHVFENNNFGVVRAAQTGGGLSLSWNLYGSTGREEEVVRLKRIELSGGA